MDIIIAWLNENRRKRDYYTGLALLKKHGKSIALQNRIERALKKGKNNKVEKRLLTSALQDIAGVKRRVTYSSKYEDVPFRERKQEKKPGKLLVSEKYEYASKNTGNSFLDQSARRTQALFNRRQILENDLGNHGDYNEIETVRKRIKVLEEIEAINEEMVRERVKRLYFQEHGELPKEDIDSANLVMDSETLKKRLKLVQTNISKTKKKLENKDATRQEKSKWKLKLQGFEAEKREIENQKEAVKQRSDSESKDD